MKKLLLILIIFLAGCVAAPEPGSYYVIPADGTITPDYTFCDGADCWYVAYLDTPAPTHTPIPTDTPAIEPTPTEEPSITPIPTFPPVETCELKAGASNLRIRAGAGTQFDPTPDSPWEAGVIKTFNAFRYDATNTYLWGQHVTGGWSAVFITSGTWLVFGTGQTETCQDVNGWPANLTPPAPIVMRQTALLWHAVTNANGQEMLASYSMLNSAGILGGVKPYSDTGRCIEALDNGNICVYRWPVLGTDCPDLNKNPTAEGERWMRTYDNAVRGALFGYANTNRLWIEVVNECDYGQDHIERLAWWSVFMDSAMDFVKEHPGWPPLVMPTFGPGHGSELLFRMWKPQLMRLASMNGLLGDHAYTPWHANGLCVFDEWLAARSVKNHEWMEQNGYGIDIAITEAARGWGDDPVDVNDFVCWYNKISQYPYIHSVALWTAGHHPTWPNANLNGHMLAIASDVAAP